MLLAVFVAISAGPLAADFFPLPEGRRATYQEESVNNSITTDVVGQEEELANGKGVHVITLQNKRELGHAFYRVEGDTVWVLSYAKGDYLPSPMPLFKVGEKKASWQFNGLSGHREGAELMSVKGESQIKGTREFEGKPVQVLQVKITAIVGSGAARETVEQIAAYGKGIGLMEMSTKTTVGKRSQDSTLKLLKLESPGG